MSFLTVPWWACFSNVNRWFLTLLGRIRVGSPLKVLEYDIETAPLISHIWRPNMKFVPQNMMIHDTFLLTWSTKWWGTDQKVQSARVTKKEAKARDDCRIVGRLAELMREADVIVAHNGDKFDWPIVNSRLLLNRLEPLGYVTKIDTLKLSRKHFGFSHHNLDYLGRVFGEGQKIPTDWDLWDRCVHGDTKALKEMETYNRHDVDLLDRVFYRMLPYVDRVARLFEAVQVEEDICLYCGSKKKESRGRYRTQAGAFPKFRCLGQLPDGSTCGKYRRGRRSIRHAKAEGHPL
jgi:RNase_H superfamily